MDDLIERLERAHANLNALADGMERGSATRVRLQGKIAGVWLALSYAREAVSA